MKGCIFIDIVPEPRDFPVGSPAPNGYMERHAWAKAQLAGGLRQRRCKACKRWRFPQEFPCCDSREDAGIADRA